MKRDRNHTGSVAHQRDPGNHPQRTAGGGLNRLLQRTALLLGAIVLSACSTTPDIQKQSAQESELYDGQPIVTFLAENRATSPQEALERGDRALARSQVDRALFEYIQAFEMEPTNTQALLKIGDIHALRGNLPLAMLSYRKALSLEAGLILAHQGLGLALFKLKRPEQAKPHLHDAIEMDKTRITSLHPLLKGDQHSPLRAYNAMGVLLDLEGQHSDARLYYKQALAIDPRYVDALNNLGYSYYLSGQWSFAEQQYRAALKLAPDYQQAWRNLGLVYARMEKYINAMNALTRVMPAEQAYNDIGYICMMDQRYHQAEQFFLKAIKLSPSYYEVAKNNLLQARRMMQMELTER